MEIQEYLQLPYNIIIKHHSDETGDYYSARVLELEGCRSHAGTREQAIDNIYEAMEGWFEVALEKGLHIPPPETDMEYSGTLSARLPRSVHAGLAKGAQFENTSINQYLLYLITSNPHFQKYINA